MEELNKPFWIGIQNKYPSEAGKFLDWVIEQVAAKMSTVFRVDRDRVWGTPGYVMLGLFIQYTMEHDPKRNWFQIYGYGSVTDQITRWFEAENRKNKGEEIVTNRHYLPMQL